MFKEEQKRKVKEDLRNENLSDVNGSEQVFTINHVKFEEDQPFKIEYFDSSDESRKKIFLKKPILGRFDLSESLRSTFKSMGGIIQKIGMSLSAILASQIFFMKPAFAASI